MPYNDIDCDDTWALLTALSLKIRSNGYDPRDLKEWPTGTVMRLQAVTQWAKEIHKQFTQQHHWMGINGVGGARDMHVAILTTMRSRASLRQANAVLREIWVTPYNGEILDLLDLESLNNCQEARDAFPQEVFDTAGYPVVCWRYGAPIDQRTINKKNTISKSNNSWGSNADATRSMSSARTIQAM